MHPFRKYCLDKKIYMRDLAVELNVDDGTLYRITNGLGSLRTRTIIDWCRRNYIDPWDVFCAPANMEKPRSEVNSLRNRNKRSASPCTPTP